MEISLCIFYIRFFWCFYIAYRDFLKVLLYRDTIFWCLFYILVSRDFPIFLLYCNCPILFPRGFPIIYNRIHFRLVVPCFKTWTKKCPMVSPVKQPSTEKKSDSSIRSTGCVHSLEYIASRAGQTAVLVLRHVHLVSQSFLTLNWPGIFYSTHAVHTHASAAATMNEHAWTSMDNGRNWT